MLYKILCKHITYIISITEITFINLNKLNSIQQTLCCNKQVIFKVLEAVKIDKPRTPCLQETSGRDTEIKNKTG